MLRELWMSYYRWFGSKWRCLNRNRDSLSYKPCAGRRIRIIYEAKMEVSKTTTFLSKLVIDSRPDIQREVLYSQKGVEN